MHFPTSKCLLSGIFAFSYLAQQSDAHGYLKTPRSRNFVAHEDGTWGSAPGVPQRETCPHCLNMKEAHKLCGIGNALTDYDDWKDSQGNPMAWTSQGVFEDGDLFTVESVLTTNHAGHMEMWLCDDVDNPTQECFESNPATLIEDVAHGGPVDSNYPERAYFASGEDHFKFTYKLPDGLVGDKIMIQWRYITANSCFPPGYKNSEVYSILRDLGWLRAEGMGDCIYPLSPTGDRGMGSPEQFFNCAEISIYPTGSKPPSAPVSQPVSPPVAQPVSQPDAQPVSQPVAQPVASPTSSSGYCNWGTTGNSANSVCDGNVEGGDWCNHSESQCLSCGGKWCTNGGPTPPSPNPGPAPTPPTGTPPTGMATTTRYWDCSGGACGCAYLPFEGDDSRPAHCYSNAMFEAPADNIYGAKFYGTAAVSPILFDPDNRSSWRGEGCGKCWKVTGTANLNDQDTTSTTLVLKGANVCPSVNTLCSGNKVHFDIAAPGFDVLAFSLAHECAEREPDEAEGFAACSAWMISNQDPTVNCDCSKFTNTVLRAGCENFRSLNWDNAPVEYEEVPCPFELDRQNCWEENNNGYPFGIPQFCASNVDDSDPPVTPAPNPVSSPAPTLAPVSSPTTKSPVTSLTPSPTPHPSLRVTPQPTPNPTPNPTSSPTKAPVDPPTGDNEHCCSFDMVNCHTDDWCNASSGNCGGCNGNWISTSPPADCRIPKWGACTNDVDGCCAPSVCTGNSIYYKQCL